MSIKDILMEAFWAKKSGRHGSGKFHYWDDTSVSICKGKRGRPTTYRRREMPHLHCLRCRSILEERLSSGESSMQHGDDSNHHYAAPTQVG